MHITPANASDINEIMPIYAEAKKFMRSYGNTRQWNSAYPTKELILSDIAAGNFYKMTEGGEIAACFTLIIGEDPTYKIIEGGSWSSEMTYGTIHRLASCGKARGVAAACFDFCRTKIGYLRIDTHEDNLPMQKAILNYGFRQCGIIHIADGSPRLAYDFYLEGTQPECNH